jgi:hypothetical protein
MVWRLGPYLQFFSFISWHSSHISLNKFRTSLVTLAYFLLTSYISSSMSSIQMSPQDNAVHFFSKGIIKNWVCNCLSLFNQFFNVTTLYYVKSEKRNMFFFNWISLYVPYRAHTVLKLKEKNPFTFVELDSCWASLEVSFCSRLYGWKVIRKYSYYCQIR